MLYRVVLPYAVYGIIVRNGTVVDAVPIGRWAVGRTLNWFQQWVGRKGGMIESYVASI